ncbi:MAG: DUF3667 domain-containing protein [Ferruginibacter sp.]
MICKKCQTEIGQHFCPNCGHPAVLKRIDGHYILHEIIHVLHFEKGILFTIKEMITNPGKNVRHFLKEDRSRLVKPLVFLFMTSLVFTIFNNLFHIEEKLMEESMDISKLKVTVTIVNWIQEHYGYSNLIIAVFIALWASLFFRKQGDNIYEILILLCFVMGMGMIVYTVIGVIQVLTQVNLSMLEIVIGFGYCTWSIGQFFSSNGKVVHYVKAFFAYLLGVLSFIMIAIIIGIIGDVLLHK